MRNWKGIQRIHFHVFKLLVHFLSTRDFHNVQDLFQLLARGNCSCSSHRWWSAVVTGLQNAWFWNQWKLQLHKPSCTCSGLFSLNKPSSCSAMKSLDSLGEDLFLFCLAWAFFNDLTFLQIALTIANASTHRNLQDLGQVVHCLGRSSAAAQLSCNQERPFRGNGPFPSIALKKVQLLKCYPMQQLQERHAWIPTWRTNPETRTMPRCILAFPFFAEPKIDVIQYHWVQDWEPKEQKEKTYISL